MERLSICLSEVELNDYLSGALLEEKKKDVENHLENCKTCLEKIVFAYQTVKEFNKIKPEGVRTTKSIWKKNIWLLGAIIVFILSFLVSRYFIQLLVATILMGGKWIFESVNARILIMIYEAWKKGGEKEASKILETLNDRLK